MTNHNRAPNRLAVGPDYLDPETYEVNERGCFIWKHATIGGAPIVNRDGRHVSVRRVLMPEVRPDEIVRVVCGERLCVNRAHFEIAPAGRMYHSGRASGEGMIDRHGRPKPRSYVVNEHGCHLWKGFVSATAGPQATWQGRHVRVRALVLGIPYGSGVKIKPLCGEPACINPRHLYEPRAVRAFKRYRFKEDRLAVNMARGPDELRDLRWIRSDLARLLALDPDNRARLTPNARWAVEQYVQGWSLCDLAKVAEVSRQALSQQIKLADRRLRKYSAQTQLQ